VENEMTSLKKQLQDKMFGYEQQRIEQARQRRETEDREWGAWMDTPEALIDIIRKPDLAIRPSERIYSARDILALIMAGRNP